MHFIFTIGNSMIVNKNPDMNPNKMEKLSTIGKSPKINNPIRIASVLNRDLQGSANKLFK